MAHRKSLVIYWDASAILSALIKDSHSDEAQKWAKQEGIHLISTLSYSEVLTVLARMRRERLMSEVLVEAAIESLNNGPWRRLNLSPVWKIVVNFSKKWPLRGVDLWHLATAKSIQEEIPELLLLTFDHRLKVAAQGEGLSV